MFSGKILTAIAMNSATNGVLMQLRALKHQDQLEQEELYNEQQPRAERPVQNNQQPVQEVKQPEPEKKVEEPKVEKKEQPKEQNLIETLKD